MVPAGCCLLLQQPVHTRDCKAIGYASSVKATDTSANGWSIYNSVSGQALGSLIVVCIGLREYAGYVPSQACM
jgi:hypothetical protein